MFEDYLIDQLEDDYTESELFLSRDPKEDFELGCSYLEELMPADELFKKASGWDGCRYIQVLR